MSQFLATDKLKDAIDVLHAHGVPCSLEYPGFIAVPKTNDLYYAFGFANGPLGWDLSNGEGDNLDGGESDLTEDASVNEIAEYIVCIVQR